MRHHSGEGKTAKKKAKLTAETGFEAWELWKEAVEDDDIDRADFFDPEEFGYRRRGFDAPRA
jgi:hypothetical protein